MAVQIQEAIQHRIEKEAETSGAGAATTYKRTECLPVDHRLEQLVDEILKIYGKSVNNGYGTFDDNHVVYRFPSLLSGYVLGGGDFIACTQDAVELIAAKMAEEFFSTGGYALFLRYTNLGQDWLLIAMLKLKPGIGVDEQTLDLSDTLSLDIDHLHEAARIDLGKWQENTQPYLSFIKKRQGGENVSRYLRTALGCTEYTDAKHHTEQMHQAFDAYCEQNGWTREQKIHGQQRVYDYCEARHKADEPVNLISLSAVIDDQSPEAFSAFVRENGFEIGETFKPHRSTYVRLNRVQRSFGSVKVSFDVQDITDGRVSLSEDGALVINNLPAELIAEIKRYQANDDDPAAE